MYLARCKNVYSIFIIRMPDERAWHPVQENEAIVSKKYCSTILDRIFEKLCICLLLLHYWCWNNILPIR